MKEDYLWNKTGNDAEIERLENALKSFRYQEDAPPALPSKIVPFKVKNRSGFFNLILSFGALAAVAIICFGVWLYFSKKTVETAKDLPQITEPAINQISPLTIETKMPTNPQAKQTEKIETPKQPITRQFDAVKKIVPQVANRNNSAARNFEARVRNEPNARKIETPKPAVKLTKEETYAYNQLLLALSITGSQLKLVKDKIDAAENSR